MLVHGNANLTIQDGLSSKNTILTYQLEQWQVKLLCESKQIKGRALKVFIADDFTDLYAIPYFIGFFNFSSVQDEDKQCFLEYWRECSEPLSPAEIKEIEKELEEKFEINMPVTYIFNCNFPCTEKMPYLFIDNDLFESPDKLKLAILQEIKNLEGRGRWASPNSIRLGRVLRAYVWLVHQGWITQKMLEKLEREDPISPRMFQKDMREIKELDPNVRYNRIRKRYELVIKRDGQNSEDDNVVANKKSGRLSRVLWLYRQLVYKGSITKEELDKQVGALSTRTFQRDIQVIKEENPNIVYDSINNRYILRSRRKGAECE